MNEATLKHKPISIRLVPRMDGVQQTLVIPAVTSIDLEDNGTLILYHPEGTIIAVFAPNQWEYCGDPLPEPTRVY